MNNTTVCDELLAKMLSGNFTLDDMLELVKCDPNATVQVRHRIIPGSQSGLLERLVLAYTIVLTVSSILGMIGNLSVIIVYVKRFQSLNCCRVLNLHLACCDFTFATMKIFTAVPGLIGKIGQPRWPFGLAFCKITATFSTLGSIIAVQTILMIAIERYRAILHPLTAMTSSRRKVKIGLLISWIISIATSIPIIFVSKKEEKTEICKEIWGSYTAAEKAYNLYLLVMFSILPLSVIAYCYSRIIKELNKPNNNSGIYANMSTDARKQRRAGELAITKMLIFVVVAFFVCVLPTRIANVIDSFTRSYISMTSKLIYHYVGYLTYPLHVAVNPFIYCIKDKELRPSCCKKDPAILSKNLSTSNSTNVEVIPAPSVKLVAFVNPRN